MFYSAAGRQGLHVWRQRISPATFEPIGEPELMTPGAEHSFYPAAAAREIELPRHSRRHQSLVRRHRRRQPAPPLARFGVSRGAQASSVISRCRGTGARSRILRRGRYGGELHVRELESGADTMVGGDLRQSRVSGDLPKRGSRSPTGRSCRDRRCSVRCFSRASLTARREWSATTVVAARANGSMNGRCSSKRSAPD